MKRQPLKPDTFYWIKAYDKKRFDELRMCQTENWITTHGYGLYLFGGNRMLYAHDFPEDEFEFIEIVAPA